MKYVFTFYEAILKEFVFFPASPPGKFTISNQDTDFVSCYFSESFIMYKDFPGEDF